MTNHAAEAIARRFGRCSDRAPNGGNMSQLQKRLDALLAQEARLTSVLAALAPEAREATLAGMTFATPRVASPKHADAAKAFAAAVRDAAENIAIGAIVIEADVYNARLSELRDVINARGFDMQSAIAAALNSPPVKAATADYREA